MSDEKKEPRVKIDDLPEQERELTTDEVKAVKGGALAGKMEIGALKASPTDGMMETVTASPKIPTKP